MGTFQIDFGESRQSKIVGIDLGTTNSLVAVMDLTGPRILEDVDGRKIVPSIVSLDEDERLVAGEPARDLLLTRPERTVYSVKRLMGRGAPDIGAMRAGREALKDHLRYFESLLEVRNWLAGNSLSFADFACAGQLSIMDYLDEINWTRYPALKTWYMVIKSRPCFRALLSDRLPGVPASRHYTELDF